MNHRKNHHPGLRSRFATLLTLAALGLGAPACASFHVRAPDGFAELDDTSDYDYRAVNADGVVVAVRALPNRPRANLDFWSRAADQRLRARGYALDEVRAVRSATGVAGRQMRYSATQGGRAHRYWVTVFVTDGAFLTRARVFVLEAGGDREVFDPAAAAVERVVGAFET